MSSTIDCEGKERLIAYLYGEDSAAERAAVERHLAGCAACTEEVQDLQHVRRELAEWQPPASNAHFRLARAPEAARPLWRQPAWGLAAAATLLLAVGAAVANLDIRVGRGEVVIRTGWAPASAVTAQASPQAGVTPVLARAAHDAEWQAALKDVEARLRDEMARTTVAPAASADATGRDMLLREVRGLISESEKRQQNLLARRVTDLVQDVEAQRRADLVRIEQNMGQIEGLTGAEAVRQRELLNYLVRVSQRR